MSHQLLNAFNAQAIDPTQSAGFKPLMLGKYPCVIIESEVKGNKDASTGGQVLFEIQSTHGEHAGKTGQWVLNLYHNNDDTRMIAERQLSAVCHATGRYLINKTSDLHNAPFALEVTEQPLTNKQLSEQAEGKRVTPFRQVRVLMPDGSDVVPMGQQQQQPQQGGNGGGWGGGQQQPQTQAPAPAPTPAANGWGNGGGQQTQAPSPAPAQGGGWAQNNGGGQKPAWGKQ